MSNKKLFFLILCIGWTGIVFAMGQSHEKPKSSDAEDLNETGPMKGKTFGEYVSQGEEETPMGEGEENELLAPVAKPVVEVMEGVSSAVEPMLEEKTLIEDEKGEPKVKMVPKEGKVFKHEF